jgi:hypothetical protein
VPSFEANAIVIREAPMLDKPEKTRELMATLEAALPFEVALMPDLIEHLARQQKAHCRFDSCRGRQKQSRTADRMNLWASRQGAVLAIAAAPRTGAMPRL